MNQTRLNSSFIIPYTLLHNHVLIKGTKRGQHRPSNPCSILPKTITNNPYILLRNIIRQSFPYLLLNPIMQPSQHGRASTQYNIRIHVIPQIIITLQNRLTHQLSNTRTIHFNNPRIKQNLRSLQPQLPLYFDNIPSRQLIRLLLLRCYIFRRLHRLIIINRNYNHLLLNKPSHIKLRGLKLFNSLQYIPCYIASSHLHLLYSMRQSITFKNWNYTCKTIPHLYQHSSGSTSGKQ
mmetsp:Transcript_31886/g.5767  ORF Transcript_31886/g.5767 Transcript_31886/m.5767 type:complete len:235 (-) Transcript_31886:444-1148(-)